MTRLHLEEKRMETAQATNGVPAGLANTSTATTAPKRYFLMALAAIYVVVSLYYIMDTRSALSSFKATQRASIDKLSQRQEATENDLKASNEALAQRLGMTEQELHQRMRERATELARQQQGLERRLQEQQKEQAAQKEQIGQVSGEVANVRTELGGAKSDIAATRTDLESTKVKLDRAIGDLTGQSSLIAHTREELEELKHRGDRNYYEFTMSKNARPTSVSNINLQLKKVNAKKSKFTLNVMADDRTIEKKDRGVAEPLQFYTGRDHLLYEVVIFSIDKNTVSGYLSTPKTVVTAWGR